MTDDHKWLDAFTSVLDQHAGCSALSSKTKSCYVGNVRTCLNDGDSPYTIATESYRTRGPVKDKKGLRAGVKWFSDLFPLICTHLGVASSVVSSPHPSDPSTTSDPMDVAVDGSTRSADVFDFTSSANESSSSDDDEEVCVVRILPPTKKSSRKRRTSSVNKFKRKRSCSRSRSPSVDVEDDQRKPLDLIDISDSTDNVDSSLCAPRLSWSPFSHAAKSDSLCVPTGAKSTKSKKRKTEQKSHLDQVEAALLTPTLAVSNQSASSLQPSKSVSSVSLAVQTKMLAALLATKSPYSSAAAPLPLLSSGTVLPVTLPVSATAIPAKKSPAVQKSFSSTSSSSLPLSSSSTTSSSISSVASSSASSQVASSSLFAWFCFACVIPFRCLGLQCLGCNQVTGVYSPFLSRTYCSMSCRRSHRANILQPSAASCSTSSSLSSSACTSLPTSATILLPNPVPPSPASVNAVSGAAMRSICRMTRKVFYADHSGRVECDASSSACILAAYAAGEALTHYGPMVEVKQRVGNAIQVPTYTAFVCGFDGKPLPTMYQFNQKTGFKRQLFVEEMPVSKMAGDQLQVQPVSADEHRKLEPRVSEWAQIPPAADLWTTTCKPFFFEIKSDSPAYEAIVAPFLATFNSTNRQPNSNSPVAKPVVVSVKLFCNPTSDTLYDAQRKRTEQLAFRRRRLTLKDLESKPTQLVDVGLLFHGTASTNLESVLENSILPGMCSPSSWHGIGSYYAIYSSYSRKYAVPDSNGVKHMIVADVCVGAMCLAAKGEMIGSLVVGSPIPGDRADTSVDDLLQPQVYCCFERNATRPRAVISFTETRA